jgi:hypothetical protein
MKVRMLAATAILALGSVCSLWNTSEARSYRYRTYGSTYNSSRIVIPAGTSFNVRLDSKISTEDAQRGDTWTGTVTQSVIAGNRVVIPAGTPVEGVVTSAAQGTHNSRPQLGLAVRRVNVDGGSRVMNADTEPIVAGSNRAKKIGAIAGGAAVGALLGHTIAKDKHGTLIGGLLGGAAGYGLTRHALRTMQLKPGTVLTFTTRGDVLAWR